MSVDTAYRVSPLFQGDPEWLGPYQLTGRLGSGGMGVVYLAVDPYDRYVAVKLVHADLAVDPEFRDRFRSEVEKARKVPSYSTAEVLDADLDHQPPYLVVEYVDGPSLGEVVDDSGPLSYANLHAMAVGVATALVGIHAAGVIHRDLKPENVLLAPGSPKVIDFGIARAFEATTGHTRTDQMVGTVAYMAPERITGDPALITASSDIFAWGCVVAYAGTGRTPYNGDTPAATAARILTQPPRLDGLAEPLRSLVARALAKDPAERPTARELLDLLMDDKAPAAPVPVAVPPRTRPQHHAPAWMITALAVLLVVAGIATVVAVFGGHNAPVAVGVDAPITGGGNLGTPASAGPGVTIPQLPAASSAPPTPKPAPSPRPTVGPTTGPAVIPAGRVLVQDALTDPGLWRNTGTLDSECVVQDVLRVTRAFAGEFQCSGPTKELKDGIAITATAILQTQASCASIWFHWDDKTGGQVLRICQEGFQLVQDEPGDQQTFGTLSLSRPLALHKAFKVRLEINGGSVTVTMNGQRIGVLPLPEDSPKRGEIRLGITVVAQVVLPPFTVNFSDIDVRTL
jgi:hypothetical protein